MSSQLDSTGQAPTKLLQPTIAKSSQVPPIPTPLPTQIAVLPELAGISFSKPLDGVVGAAILKMAAPLKKRSIELVRSVTDLKESSNSKKKRVLAI